MQEASIETSQEQELGPQTVHLDAEVIPPHTGSAVLFIFPTMLDQWY